jgi:hypothetical protein
MSQRVHDLFNIRYGHSLSLNRLTVTDPTRGIAFVSRTARNNGVSAWVEPVEGVMPEPAGLLTVCLRSRNYTLATFVQPRSFYTGFHVYILEPRQPMSLREKIWFASCIEANRFRYNFGRQANRSLANLPLPDEEPAWLSKVEMPATTSAGQSSEMLSLRDISTWKRFRLVELFDLTRGRSVLKREMQQGTTAYVSASAECNGITAWIDLEPDWPGGQITVASNGNGVGEAFYQPFPFIASGDVTVLNPKTPMNAAAALFVCTVIRAEKYRFNYGRKWVMSRMRESTIRLPADLSGKPDWSYADTYIMLLPLAKLVLVPQ